MNKWWRLAKAIWRREPFGHIRDLWGLATGRLVVCGKKPYEYLMLKKYVKPGETHAK
jgi:hypothetical protein